MSTHNITVKQKLAVTLDSNSGSNIIPLFTYTPYSKSGYRLIDEYLEITEIKAISWIYNIEQVEFPIFQVEDSESMRLFTAINLEWNSPRIQLDIMLNIDNSPTWHNIASYSLLNQNPYPFREYDFGNHALGSNAIIGFKIVNVGDGILQSTIEGNDRVVISADLTRQIFLQELIDTSNKILNNFTTTAASVVAANPYRKGITFFNNSALTIYLDTVPTVSTTTYLIRLLPNAYYEAPKPLYSGVYYGRTATGSTAIEIREFL